MKRIAMAVAMIGAPFLLLAQTASAFAQVPSNQGMDRGGPAGCYDPNRVSARQQAMLERMGSSPCPSSRTDTTRPSSSRPSSTQPSTPRRPGFGSWFYLNANGDPSASAAYVRSNEDPAVFLMAGCRPYGPVLQIGLFGREDRANMRAALFMGPQHVARDFTVTAIARGAPYSFAPGPRRMIGDNEIEGQPTISGGGAINAGDAQALASATVIRVTIAGRTFTFPVADSAWSMRRLPCAGITTAAPQPVVGTPLRSWLVGGWAPEGAYCASDNTLSLKADGSFYSGGVGRWSVSGNTLTFTQRSGKTLAQRVTRSGPNELLLDAEHYKRCPSPSGEEPWHPGERF